MEPLENLNNKYVSKIEVLKELIDYTFDLHQVNENSVQKKIQLVRNEYCIGVNCYVAEYLTHKSDSAYKGFEDFIRMNNILGRIENIYSEFEAMLQILPLGEETEAINKLREKYNSINIKIDYSRKDIFMCKTCDIKMSIVPELSELQCPKCNIVVLLEGAVFDDTQIYTQQNTLRAKDYDPNKHCDRWIKCIQARENRNIPQDIINKIDRRAIAHYTRGNTLLPMTNMTCKLIREWLKAESAAGGKKLTTFNNDAALLRKLITSLHGQAVVPPQLTYDEEEKMLLDFSRAMAEYDNVVNNAKLMNKIGIKGRSNKPYYPYGLFKILRLRYRAAKTQSERDKYKKLIEGIHIQSDDTLVDNDRIWQQICLIIPDFTYEFTDRNFILECL